MPWENRKVTIGGDEARGALVHLSQRMVQIPYREGVKAGDPVEVRIPGGVAKFVIGRVRNPGGRDEILQLELVDPAPAESEPAAGGDVGADPEPVPEDPEVVDPDHAVDPDKGRRRKGKGS